MNQTTLLQTESSPTTSTNSANWTKDKAGVVESDGSITYSSNHSWVEQEYDFNADCTDLDTYVRKSIQNDPSLEQLLREARMELAGEIASTAGRVNLATLRMQKGLSQAELATAIGSKQPHIARIEAGQGVVHETMKKLAQALDVDMNTLSQVLDATNE